MDTHSSDEIDLQELAIRLFRYFKKNFLFITILTTVGIASGIVGWFGLPKVYESKMILMSDILTESYSQRLTESLVNLIKEKNTKTLAFRLALTETEAAEIKSIEIESVKDTDNSEKQEATIFIVTADIGDKATLPKLQEGIISFLRNNEFVKIRVRQREVFYNTMIEKIGRELQSLDSLKRRLFEGKPIYAKTSEMLLIDPTSIYTKIIDLNKQQVEYKNALELANSIQLVEGFTVFEKPSEPKLSYLLVGGLLLGFFIAVGMLTFEQLKRLAKQTDTQALL